MIPLPDYVRLVMAVKEKWIEFPGYDSGEVVPTILIEQDGRISYMIHLTVPHPGIAAHYFRMLHTMLSYDAMILAHEIRMKFKREGWTDAELEKYKAGDFERLANEGKAGGLGIIDAMLVQRFEAGDLLHTSHVLPFLYSGKGTPFAWLASQFLCAGGDDDLSSLGGAVPEALRDALKGPKVEHLKFKGVVKAPPQRMRQLAAAVALSNIGADPHCQLLTASHAWGNLLP